MPRTYTAQQAQKLLGVDRNQFYRLVDKGHLQTIKKPGSPHRLYDAVSVERMAREMQQFRVAIREDTQNDDDRTLTFCQAIPEDMDGVYSIAHELFGHTTPAEQRKPMVAACPQGNYIVLRGNEIVAYIHVLPLYPDVLDNFMKGKIRGWDITANDLDPFTPGKEVDCLVRSIGATLKYGEEEQRRFAYCLLRGTIRELMKLAQSGVIIGRLYATSSKGQGIRICYSADMTFYSKPLNGDRLTFVVDVLTSDNPTFARYRAYLERAHQIS